MSLTVSPKRIVEESHSPLLASHASWPRRQLGEVASILNGYAFSSKQFKLGEGVPLIRIRDIFRDSTTVGFVGAYDPKYIIRPGDLLVGMDGDFNCTRWRGPEALLNQRVCKISPNPDILDLDFLTQLLPAYLQAIHEVTSSTTVTHLSSRDVATIPIPIPPLDDQRLIAERLDEIALKRSGASGHVTAGLRALQRFPHAALAAAWREASEDSLAFRLEELLREPMRNGYSARPISTVTPFRVLTLTATTSGWFDERHFKYTAEEFDKDSPFWVRPGDILVQRGNTAEYVGVPALYEGEDHQFLYPDLMMRVRVRPEVGTRYVWYMLLSPQLRNLVRAQATGSAGNMPKVNQKILNDVLIPLPDAEHRAEIVNRLDLALNMAARLVKRTDTVSRIVDRSSQAVLAKAFRGELLTTQASPSLQEHRAFVSADMRPRRRGEERGETEPQSTPRR